MEVKDELHYKINHYPSKQRPGLIREEYDPLIYYSPARYSKPSRYNSTKCLITKHDIHPNPFLPQTFQAERSKPYHETIYNRYIEKSDSDKYYTVTNVDANRLDVISYNYYGSAIYWWAIARANIDLLFDPFNIPIGTTLRIPSMSSIYSSVGGIM